MTPAEEALRDMWLAEMGAVVREVPRSVREEQRKNDRRIQRQVEEMQVEAASVAVPNHSTGCAQTCAQNGPGKVA